MAKSKKALKNGAFLIHRKKQPLFLPKVELSASFKHYKLWIVYLVHKIKCLVALNK